MKISYTFLPAIRSGFTRTLVALLAIFCAFLTPTLAQTSGGTTISNQASAVYTDSANNNYSTVSNTVTVTVANVSGLRILPDDAVNPAVVPGDTNAFFLFTVTNTGNFADQVRFLASGQSLNLTGPGVITAAVIDMDSSNTITAGDINIFSNGADVLHALAQNASATIVVRATINAAASAGDTVQVFLGDAATGAAQGYDNQTPDNPATPSLHEVRTVAATSVNGVREARGDIRVTVQNDVQLRAVLTVPAGPVALGGNINYSMQLCNDGNRTANSMNLGAFSGVYIVMPVPTDTTLSASNTFPAGTLFTQNDLTTAPEAAAWTNVVPAPAVLPSIKRVAFNVGATLAGGGTCSASVALIVTVTTADATTPIYAVVDSFATNTVNFVQTDQSDAPGGEVTNRGDRNADFNEPRLALDPVNPGQGIRQPTLLQQLGDVLIGPAGQPFATGPGNSDDTDFTNRSVTTGIASVPPCAGPPNAACSTNAPGFIIFTNTVRNTGNATDTITLTAPTVPAGFTVGVSTNPAGPFTTISGGGSFVLAPLAMNTNADVYVRVDAPAVQAILTGFDSIVQAASGNTPASTNQTIDRLYTGFVRLDKSVTVVDASDNPSATIPGAIIVYQITYTNVMTAPPVGSNSSALTATNLVITEDGSAGGNNWATYTTQVTAPMPSVSTAGGSVTDGVGNPVTALTNVLKGNVPNLAPGETGTFLFRRLIN